MRLRHGIHPRPVLLVWATNATNGTGDVEMSLKSSGKMPGKHWHLNGHPVIACYSNLRMVEELDTQEAGENLWYIRIYIYVDHISKIYGNIIYNSSTIKTAPSEDLQGALGSSPASFCWSQRLRARNDFSAASRCQESSPGESLKKPSFRGVLMPGIWLCFENCTSFRNFMHVVYIGFACWWVQSWLLILMKQPETTCLLLAWLITRNSTRAASCLVFKAMTSLNSFKPYIVSFIFESV